MDKKGENRKFSLNNFLPENHRGQGMSITTIILLILGIVVLVVLVLGFSIGWNKILPFVSQNNVNTISQQCNFACTSNSIFDFCSKIADLIADGKTIRGTCFKFSTNTSFTQYGIETCPALQSSCPQTQ